MTLSLLLIPYLIVVAIFIIVVLINIYHIATSAALTTVSFAVTFFILALGVLTIYGTWYLLQGTDWQQPLIGSQLQFSR